MIENDFEVLALARSKTAAEKIINLGATPVMDDLRSLSTTTTNALAQCNYVLHAAAHMDFTYDPKPYFELNVDATERLLELSQQEGIQKFIYISAAPVVPGSPVRQLTEDKAGADLPQAL